MTNLSRNCITFESIKETFENTSQKQLKRIYKQYMVNNQSVSFKRLILSSNTISTIDIDILNNNSIVLVSLLFHYFEVLLDHNDLVCDCKVYSFYSQMHGRGKHNIAWEVNIHNKINLKCVKPDHLHDKWLYDLEASSLGCMENFLCPEHCNCFRRSMDKAVIVSCKEIKTSTLPIQLPLGSTELGLSDNLITKFDTPYPYLAKLEKLNLHNNLIDSISSDVFDILDKGNLRELRLDANRLWNLPQKTDVFMVTNLSHLTFGNNSWECNCHTLWMKHWLIVTVIVVRNALLAVGAILILCVIAVILIYVYRGEIKIILYVHCNWHPFDAAENADILDMQYDTFISYLGLDYKWVCFNLLPKLENHNPPYRVCVHDRDFMPGAYIEDNIMEAVQSSRRMIMVLSQNYLKSDGCMLEFRVTHNKVLNDRTNYLILVPYDDVNISELDEDMKLYIRTNTYLAKFNKSFYDKLLYSMPKKASNS